MSLDKIAHQLKEMNESIILIYAFNGTGKTRLSVAYKNAMKNPESGEHTGVYYNAYSEDLFVWDNDEENDRVNVELNILPSDLSRFHSFIYENSDAVRDKLAIYAPAYSFRFNPHDDIEKGIKSITFFMEGNEDVAIKISRGEERTFVLCFFLALLDVYEWPDVEKPYIFIDDPVSSLDEHNISITVDAMSQLIGEHYKQRNIVITTHHIGLFSILADRLGKGENSNSYKELIGLHLLKKTNNTLSLVKKKQGVFLYHLHLLQVLDKARKEQLYTYHFALLRQLLENISSFLGTGASGRTLDKIGIKNPDSAMALINSHSHKKAYYYQTEIMSDTDQEHFNEIFVKLTEKYQFKY